MYAHMIRSCSDSLNRFRKRVRVLLIRIQSFPFAGGFMKNPFKVKCNGGMLARKNNGAGPVDENYLKSRSVENQPISPNTLAKAPRIRGAVGVESICPYCAVGC